MKDITTLVGERYLTGFLINAICLKYCNEALLRASASLCLPSLTQTWASSGSLLSLNSKLKPYIYTAVCVNVQWILTPIHVNGNHWVLLCLNIGPSNLPGIIHMLGWAIGCSSEAEWDKSLIYTP